jgi:signal transduction histidine kinase
MIDHDDLNDEKTQAWAFTRLDGMVVLLTFIFWTINALQLSARSLISPSAFNQLDGLVLARMASLGTGIVLTLGMWVLLRRLHETQAFAWFWRAAALGLVVCMIHTVLNASYIRVLTDYHADSGEFFLDPRNLSSTYISFLWPIMTWSALCAVMVAGENLRRQQVRTIEARMAAQQAQLAALRLQIQPHFLFNTLNAVSSLIGQGHAQEADATLLQLAGFLKHTLAAGPRELVSLESEIDSQQRYLDIEEIRFPDRLRRRLQIDPSTLAAMAPSLILQPFVENAVKHGLAQSIAPVTVEIGARRDGDQLRLWVSDDGAGAACTGGVGRSLANVEQRLKLLYGPQASLSYGLDPAGGWRAEIQIPFEIAA